MQSLIQESLAARFGAQMNEQIESLQATIALARSAGAAQARIALEPPELGAVHIHLTQTENGLVARVSAETPIAAQALSSGQAELRNTLSSLGVTLLRMDIGSSLGNQGEGRRARESSNSNGRSSFSAREEGPAAPEGVAGFEAHPALQSHYGTVNVLA